MQLFFCKLFLFCDLDLGVWPIFWKLSLLKSSEQLGLELWCFTWVFLVIRVFFGYQYVLPCDFDLEVWHRSARALLYYMSISRNNTSITICVLVILAIIGIAHYRGHLCFTNTSCWFLDSNILFPAASFCKIPLQFSFYCQCVELYLHPGDCPTTTYMYVLRDQMMFLE